MLYLIKLFPEITVKSKPVRRRQTRQVRRNIRSVLITLDPQISVIEDWDSIEVETALTDPDTLARIRERLADLPGISLFMEVEKYPLPADLQGILARVLPLYHDRLRGRSFAVRCKRMGEHPFQSTEVESFVGAGLLQHSEATGVDLENPELVVSIEVRRQQLYVVKQQLRGLGGFPLGCQDGVLSLLSGGFDSAVSSYHSIRRGLQTHYCFFNLGGREHEMAVKEVALFLWLKFHSSHRVKFITVPFEPVVAEILRRVERSHMAVVLKRMMLRAATRVAEPLDVRVLVTGESVAQVASQTLANLSVIDAVTDALVLRPLITSDKQEIIDQARQIGTEEFSRNVPEYCAVISRQPTTRARPDRVEQEEACFDFSLLDQAVAGARYQVITDLLDEEIPDEQEVSVVNKAPPGATVIDVRHPNEVSVTPLRLPGGDAAKVVAVPFYRLRQYLQRADRGQRLLLYCDRGMMSRLQAAHLKDAGFTKVAVLQFEREQAVAGREQKTETTS